MVTSGAITNRTDRLVARGMVTRDVDPRNRRSVLIKLTDSGRELIDRVVTSHVAFETQLLDQLSRKDQKHLARLLRALLISLGDSAPGNPLNPE